MKLLKYFLKYEIIICRHELTKVRKGGYNCRYKTINGDFYEWVTLSYSYNEHKITVLGKTWIWKTREKITPLSGNPPPE